MYENNNIQELTMAAYWNALVPRCTATLVNKFKPHLAAILAFLYANQPYNIWRNSKIKRYSRGPNLKRHTLILIELILYPSIEFWPSECHLRMSHVRTSGLNIRYIYNLLKEKYCSGLRQKKKWSKINFIGPFDWLADGVSRRRKATLVPFAMVYLPCVCTWLRHDTRYTKI
jgi:hypothetical protein